MSQGWGFGPPPAPRPGIVPLRPLGVGELLDGGLQTMRRHPRLVLGTAAVVAVVGEALQVPVRYTFTTSLTGLTRSSQTVTPDELGPLLSRALGGFSVLAAVGYVVTLLGTAVLGGLLTVVVGRAVVGAPVAAGDCWRAARTRVPGLVGLGLLTLLVELVVLAVALVPMGLVLLLGGGAVAAVTLGVLGGLAGFLAVLVIAVLLSLAPPAYVLEGESVVAAARRSVGLVRARFWPVLGQLALTVIIAALASGAISAPFSLAGQALAGTGAASSDAALTLPGLVLQALGTVIGLTLTTPFTAAVVGLLYVDTRMRREGFDIELQRASALERPVIR